MSTIGLYLSSLVRPASGLYGAAYKLVLEPARALSVIADSVSFPTFAKLKYDKEALFAKLVQFCRLNMVVVLGFVAVVFVAAEDIMTILNGAKTAVAAPAVRILCGVAALRAVSFVLPPFLDGVGRPDLSLRYSLLAALSLPLLFVVAAYGFGDRIGYLSVAWAWALGYPLAFVVLVRMALSQVDIGLFGFTRRVAPVLWCALLAVPAGYLSAGVMSSWSAEWRLTALVCTTLLVYGALLALVTGINPRAVKQALS